jgi:hypothetical protein
VPLSSLAGYTSRVDNVEIRMTKHE